MLHKDEINKILIHNFHKDKVNKILIHNFQWYLIPLITIAIITLEDEEDLQVTIFQRLLPHSLIKTKTLIPLGIRIKILMSLNNNLKESL